MDAAGIMARAEAKGGTPRGTTGTASPPGKDPLDAAGQQLQRLLQTDKPRAAELGREHVCALVKAGRREDAVKAFEQCTAIDPAFRLAAAEQVLPLAKAALEAGNVPTAISALRGFDKKYPGHALIPDVYVFSAKLMAEKMGQVETARKILQHIVERFPGHHLAQEARRTLKDLEQRSPA
jgi:TolA-binding protein